MPWRQWRDFRNELSVRYVSFAGWASVDISAELGWGGATVLERVTPIWVTLRSAQASPLSGTLVVRGNTAPPGGEREKTARDADPDSARWDGDLSVSLAGGTGHADALLEAAGRGFATCRRSLDSWARRVVGFPSRLLISSAPLLLHPFQEITLGNLPLGEDERAVLSAWATYLGGKLPGERGIISLPWPELADLLADFSRTPSPACARHRLKFGPVLSAFVSTFDRKNPFPSGIISDSAKAFCLEFLCLAGTEVEVGVWGELSPAEEGAWEGRKLACLRGCHENRARPGDDPGTVALCQGEPAKRGGVCDVTKARAPGKGYPAPNSK